MQEIRQRGLKVAVAGIPKTIDNDISVFFYNMLNPKLFKIFIFLFFRGLGEMYEKCDQSGLDR